jgi:hypothetical protein
MKCRDCKLLSEPKVFGEPDNYPSVRCTLGLWDHDNKIGVEQWYSFGESQINRGPIRKHGDMCTKGKFKKSFNDWYEEFRKALGSHTRLGRIPNGMDKESYRESYEEGMYPGERADQELDDLTR